MLMKLTSGLDCLFALLGSACIKAARKHVGENRPNGLGCWGTLEKIARFEN